MTGNHYPVLPVVGVQLYRQDVVVMRRGLSRTGVYPARSEVSHFSRRSRRRLAFVASNTDVMFTSMLTLTYPKEFPNDGKSVKRNLDNFLHALRRKVTGLSVLWFLEFQRRGAPHIHIMLRGVRVWRKMQQWASQTWYRICGTGDLKHLRAGTRLERVRSPYGARNYCVKYAHKMKQKKVPPEYRNVGRFWGHSKDVKPVMRHEMQCTNDDLIGVLEAGGWSWQKGDVVRYHTLYGASKAFTSWLSRDILVLSTSSQRQQDNGKDKKGGPDGHEITPDSGRRLWPDHAPDLWDGGERDLGADADRRGRTVDGVGGSK